MLKKKQGRSINILVNGKPVEYSDKDIVKEFSSIISELLEKREPFVLIVVPLRGESRMLSSPEVFLSSPLDVLLLEAKTQRSVIELFDEIISLRSKLGENLRRPHYVS